MTLKPKGVEAIYSLSGTWGAVVHIHVDTTDELSALNDCIGNHELIEYS